MATVLIIDDDLPSSTPLAHFVTGQGHRAICVATAEAALPHLRQNPDLLILDLAMPGFDGFDVLNALADDERYADLPVVILSGNTDPAVIAQCKRMGAKDFIYKGLGWSQICKRVAGHLDAIGEDSLQPMQSCPEDAGTSTAVQ